jgi:hypothetical protein
MKKTKSGGCGHEKMEGKKNGKGKRYLEVEITMGKMPKKQGKRK